MSLLARSSAIFFFVGLVFHLDATIFTVTSTADSGADTLRDALLNAQSGDTINIMPGLGTINIGSTTNTALPILIGVAINGNNNTISGQDTYPIFFAFSGANTIDNLTLMNGKGLGGDGGAGHGGGGGALGAGGALFVNNGATVSTTNISFSTNTVQGGNGGAPNGSRGGGGGGGGYSSNGGTSTTEGGGGGGGVFNSLGGSTSASITQGGGCGGGGVNKSNGGANDNLSGSGGGGVNLSNGGIGTAGGGGGGGVNLSDGGIGATVALPSGGGAGGGGGFGTILAGIITGAPGGSAAAMDAAGGSGGGGLGTAGGNATGSSGATGGAGGGGTGGAGALNVSAGAGSDAGTYGGGGGGGASNATLTNSSFTGGFGGNATMGGGGGGGISSSINGNSGVSNSGTGNGGSSSSYGGGGGGGASFSFNQTAFGPAGRGGDAAIGGGGGGAGLEGFITSPFTPSNAGNGGNSSLLGGGGGGGTAFNTGGNGGNGGSGGVFGGGGGGGAARDAPTGNGGSGGASVLGGGGGGAAQGVIMNGVGGTGGFGAGSGGNSGISGGGGSAFGGAVFIATGGMLTITDGIFSSNTTGAAGTGSSMGLSEGEDLYLMSGTSVNYAVTDSNSITLPDTVAGAGGMTKLGSGTLVLGNIANTFSGGVVINAGILSISDNAVLGDLSGAVTFDGGTLQLTAPTTTARTITINSSGVIDTGTFTTTFSGNIQGNGALTKIGTGTLVLSNPANTYLGDTTISDGVLSISNDANLGNPSGGLILGSNTTFQLTGPVTSNRLITLNSPTGSTIDTGTFTSTFGGIFNGNGSLTKTGTGTLAFDGQSNSYSGGTTISAGTLQGDANSLQGSIIDNATLIFNQSVTGTFNGQLNGGTGTVIKAGAGKLNFINNSSGFSGQTVVQQGELSLNTILGGNIAIQPGAILSGNGTILGDGTINGSISPGNSIGTIIVEGNYIQDTGSNYVAQINGAGQSSLIQILGTATINSDTSVNATSTDGTMLIQFPYPILHANGGRMGFFSSVTFSNPTVIPTLTYDANNVYLTIVQNFISIAKTKEQSNVAKQLDSIKNPTLNEQILLNNFFAESPDQARRSLEQMSAEQYTNVLISSVLTNHQFITRLYEPLRAVLTAKCPTNCSRFKIWGEAGGSYYSLRESAKGFHASGYEGTVGMHGSLTSNWTMGSAISFERSHFHYALNGHSNRSNILGALYAVYRPCRWYLLSDFVTGYSTGTVKRSITVTPLRYKANGNPKTLQNNLYVEAGADVKSDILLFQPFVGIEYGNYRFNNFKEYGSELTMAVEGKSVWPAYSRLGFHMNSEPFKRFTMNIDFAWQYRLTAFNNHINERFNHFGEKFTIQGVNIVRNSFIYSINLVREISDCVQLFAEFNGENWKHCASYNGMIGIKLN